MTDTWNLIGTNFTHTTGMHTGQCSTHGKLPKSIRWSMEYEGDISFYIDANICNGLDDRNDLREFGWVLESASIRPEVFDRLSRNYAHYFDYYDAIFTHNRALLALDDRFKFTICNGTWIHDIALHEKSRLVSAVSSGKSMCEGHAWRNNFIEKHRGRFDLFGNAYRHIPHKEAALNDYMFSVAIENGSYATYFTEKILDCFATGTIPLYRGAPDIGDYFNIDGIITLDDEFDFDMLSADLYYSKMDAVRDNFERMRTYHSAEDWMHEHYTGTLF